MSLIELLLKRRPKSKDYRPTVEMLEQRECPAVAVPANLTATALSSTQVKLNWSDVATEAGFRVYRWNGSQATLVAQVAKNTTTYQIDNLPPASTQWFQVQAFDLTTSATSTWATVTTPAQAIAAPASVQVTSPTLNTLTVNWSFVNGATGYNIYQYNGTQGVLIGSVTNSTNAFLVKNLAAGTNYYFQVQAVNATNSASSAWASGTTLAAGLTPPTNVKATVVSSSVIGLSWNDVSGETGYRVYASYNGQTTLLATLSANTTGYQATGLLPGRAYQFYVQSFTATSSANSAWVSATTTGAALQSITNLSATATGPSTVKLTWTEPPGAVAYRVYVWWGTYWMPWGTAGAGNGTKSVTITNLYANRTQWFMVEAIGTNGTESTFSNRASVVM